MAKLDSPWKAKVLTLFPEMFPGPLGLSLAGQGLEAGAWALEAVDIRDFAADKHRTVDDPPFGGGPGMVIRPDVVSEAIDRSEEHTSELQSLAYLVCRLLLEKKKKKRKREIGRADGKSRRRQEQ